MRKFRRRSPFTPALCIAASRLQNLLLKESSYPARRVSCRLSRSCSAKESVHILATVAVPSLLSAKTSLISSLKRDLQRTTPTGPSYSLSRVRTRTPAPKPCLTISFPTTIARIFPLLHIRAKFPVYYVVSPLLKPAFTTFFCTDNIPVLGHREFRLSTGAVIPVLLKVTTLNKRPPPTTTLPYDPQKTCAVPPAIRDPSCNDCSCCS